MILALVSYLYPQLRDCWYTRAAPYAGERRAGGRSIVSTTRL